MINTHNHYQMVKEFNTVAGNLDDVTLESIALQLDLIQEEYIETVEAFDSRNPIELVDGVADMLTVVYGLVQKLEVLGVDFNDAMKQVHDNNMSKFVKKEQFNRSVVPEKVQITAREGYYIFKDVDTGKVKKPLNFQKLELAGVVDFFKTLGQGAQQ